MNGEARGGEQERDTPAPSGRAAPSRLGGVLRPRRLLQAALVLLLIGLTLWRIDLHAVGRSFADARYGWLAFALAVYVVARFVHAVEWRMTISRVGRAPLPALFGALLVGTLVNALVPASAGDVVKIQIIANRYGLPRAGLVASRAAEALVNAVTMVAFVAAAVALPSAGQQSRNLLWVTAAAVGLVFAGTVVASRRLPDLAPRWRWLAHLPRRVGDGIAQQWPRFHEGLEVLRRPRLLVAALLFNLFGWTVDILIYWGFGQAFRLDLPLGAYLSVTVVVALITIFPITFGNVGTYELVVVGALALYAVPGHDALAYAVSTHLISTAFNIALGTVAMLIMGVQPGELFRIRRVARAGGEAGLHDRPALESQSGGDAS